MLTCITCTKHSSTGANDNGSEATLRQRAENEDYDYGGVIAGTPSTRHAIKALTSQIKDMALKASGAYKSCKPCSGSNHGHHDKGNYMDSETASDSARFCGYYQRNGSSSSTPKLWGKEMEARLKVFSSGDTTLAYVSGRTESTVFVEEDEPREWVAQVEPGVLIRFVSLPQGGNELQRIQFRWSHLRKQYEIRSSSNVASPIDISDGIIEMPIDYSINSIPVAQTADQLTRVERGSAYVYAILPLQRIVKRLFSRLEAIISRELFSKWQAQRWWTENYDKVMELYNVQPSNQQGTPLPTPPTTEDEGSRVESVKASPVTPLLDKERLPRNIQRPAAGMGYSPSDSVENHLIMQSRPYSNSTGLASTPKLSSISGSKTEPLSVDGSVSSGEEEAEDSGELSMSNASDVDSEWVEQDEPGVYITIQALPNGTRELRRVRFSRERFGEMQARVWWEQNRARIQRQYL